MTPPSSATAPGADLAASCAAGEITAVELDASRASPASRRSTTGSEAFLTPTPEVALERAAELDMLPRHRRAAVAASPASRSR